MPKKVFITGVSGQDGSYLAEFLLSKGYEVHGLVRRVATESQTSRFSRINQILDKINLHYGDVTHYPTTWKLIAKIQPDEVYHLAAQSQVKISFEDEFGAFGENLSGTHYLLSAIKELKPDCKFYFAATSEMFGQVKESPQNEDTPLNPVSPYSISKTAGFHLTKMFRQAYNVFACNGILFNHESPRRGFDFVTRKITSTVAKIKYGLADKLPLGNLAAKRDWGFSGDYVKAMWMMLQHEKPDDYVIGTGENHTVQELVEAAFGRTGLDWKKYVIVDQSLIRPAEVHHLLADSSKAKQVLGWQPDIKFHDLIAMMVDADLENAKKGVLM